MATPRRSRRKRVRRVVTTPNPTSQACTDLLVKWLLIFLDTSSASKAGRQTGLGAKAKGIVKRRLQSTGTLGARPSTGRPVKYTAEVCQLSIQLLEEHSTWLLTLQELLQLLVDMGAVETPVNRDTFSRHLREHVHSQGRYINTTSQRTIFLLAASDYPARLEFAASMLELLKTIKLEDIIFVEETTWEEGPHPKGTLPPACVRGRECAGTSC